MLDTHESSLTADTVMITGPGQPERCMLPGDPRVLSIAQFWHRARSTTESSPRMWPSSAAGETAASMLNELFHHRISTITAISPQATLFTRGEGFFENSLFSDPAGWRSLALAERRDVDCPHRPRGFLGAGSGVAACRRKNQASARARRPRGRPRQPNLDHAEH